MRLSWRKMVGVWSGMSSGHLLAVVLLVCGILSGAAGAQQLGALARLEHGVVRDLRFGGAEVRLKLSQGVPFRVFTLSAPNRLVIDFNEVDWQGMTGAELLTGDNVLNLRVGVYQPGWSRLVAELAGPMQVLSAGLETDESSGAVDLMVRLGRSGQDAFDATAGAPSDTRWDLPPALEVRPVKRRADVGRALVVVIDPGHGGIDPGAQAGGLTESHLMLTFARELQDTLRRAGGIDARLTRDADVFVSLEGRVALARAAGADLFVSLHADALGEGVAHGATVYTLAEDASDAASAALAERHDRDDILAGVDLTGADDRVATVLMDLARLENRPRSRALGRHLVKGIQNAVGPMHKKPWREAGFSVLKAADIPSVLIELGFMSSVRDLENLRDPLWRAGMAAGIRDGIRAWSLEDAALADLRRQ